MHHKSFISETWWRLICFKLLLFVNDLPLFMHKNFLKSHTSKRKELDIWLIKLLSRNTVSPSATLMTIISINLNGNTPSSKTGKNLYQHAIGKPWLKCSQVSTCSNPFRQKNQVSSTWKYMPRTQGHLPLWLQSTFKMLIIFA